MSLVLCLEELVFIGALAYFSCVLGDTPVCLMFLQTTITAQTPCTKKSAFVKIIADLENAFVSRITNKVLMVTRPQEVSGEHRIAGESKGKLNTTHVV